MMRDSKQQGMTLIEIMIALVLGAFLIGGVLQIFLNTQRTYRMQENLSRMQENGRFALEFISRDVRNADFWGCINSSAIENKLNNSATFDPFKSGIGGQDNDNNNGNNIIDGTDTITLRGAPSLGIRIKQQPTNRNASLKVIQNSGLAANEIVVISNCTAGDIFQITNINVNGGFDNIIHNTGAVSSGPGNASQNLEAKLEADATGPHDGKYGPDAQIYKLNFVTYQIQNGSGSVPSLYRSVNGSNFQELVEGIENMQILYGVDTDADKTPNYYIDAQTIINNEASATPTPAPKWQQVISVNISLLVVSLEDNLSSQPVPYTYNGTTTTPTDNRLRRVFSSTIVLRNRL